WFNRLHTLNQSTKNKLDAFYDQQKYLNMQSAHTLPLKENTKDLRFNLVYSLMRYMSAAFFLDYLESSSESTNS
nr:hypothetical protein [Gammaproteobacteria bacterium]